MVAKRLVHVIYPLWTYTTGQRETLIAMDIGSHNICKSQSIFLHSISSVKVCFNLVLVNENKNVPIGRLWAYATHKL